MYWNYSDSTTTYVHVFSTSSKSITIITTQSTASTDSESFTISPYVLFILVAVLFLVCCLVIVYLAVKLLRIEKRQRNDIIKQVIRVSPINTKALPTASHKAIGSASTSNSNLRSYIDKMPNVDFMAKINNTTTPDMQSQQQQHQSHQPHQQQQQSQAKLQNGIHPLTDYTNYKKNNHFNHNRAGNIQNKHTNQFNHNLDTLNGLGAIGNGSIGYAFHNDRDDNEHSRTRLSHVSHPGFTPQKGTHVELINTYGQSPIRDRHNIPTTITTTPILGRANQSSDDQLQVAPNHDTHSLHQQLNVHQLQPINQVNQVNLVNQELSRGIHSLPLTRIRDTHPWVIQPTQGVLGVHSHNMNGQANINSTTGLIARNPNINNNRPKQLVGNATVHHVVPTIHRRIVTRTENGRNLIATQKDIGADPNITPNLSARLPTDNGNRNSTTCSQREEDRDADTCSSSTNKDSYETKMSDGHGSSADHSENNTQNSSVHLAKTSGRTEQAYALKRKHKQNMLKQRGVSKDATFSSNSRGEPPTIIDDDTIGKTTSSVKYNHTNTNTSGGETVGGELADVGRRVVRFNDQISNNDSNENDNYNNNINNSDDGNKNCYTYTKSSNYGNYDSFRSRTRTRGNTMSPRSNVAQGYPTDVDFDRNDELVDQVDDHDHNAQSQQVSKYTKTRTVSSIYDDDDKDDDQAFGLKQKYSIAQSNVDAYGDNDDVLTQEELEHASKPTVTTTATFATTATTATNASKSNVFINDTIGNYNYNYSYGSNYRTRNGQSSTQDFDCEVDTEHVD